MLRSHGNHLNEKFCFFGNSLKRFALFILNHDTEDCWHVKITRKIKQNLFAHLTSLEGCDGLVGDEEWGLQIKCEVENNCGTLHTLNFVKYFNGRPYRSRVQCHGGSRGEAHSVKRDAVRIASGASNTPEQTPQTLAKLKGLKNAEQPSAFWPDLSVVRQQAGAFVGSDRGSNGLKLWNQTD